MASFKIYTLGCKVNQYDSADLRKKLESDGLIWQEKGANLAIINSCAVTKTAIHKGQRMINKARQENPRAKTILIGCWPKAYNLKEEKLGVDFILALKNIEQKIKKIIKKENKNLKKKRSSEVNFWQDRSRYFLKIQDGCEQFCSYCIIPYTRGRLRSRAEKDVLKEVEGAIKAGYEEIVLCGIHLGLYGHGHTTRSMKYKINLVSLIAKIIKIKNLRRIRLSSIEVNEVTDKLIALIKSSNGKICRHLHIPLQSGDDKVLRLMKRPYRRDAFRKRIKKLRKAMPEIAITTDLIVGFPGEGRKESEETYNFVKEMKFSRLHVFSFSAHEKTPAAKMPEKVRREKIKARVKNLKKLGKKLENNYIKKFKNKELEVVVSKSKKKDDFKIKARHIGKTEFYFDVEFEKKGKRNLTGKIFKVKKWNFV